MPSGPRIRANNVYGITTDNPLSAVATTFNSTGLAVLPAVSSAHAVIVLDPKRVFGEPEFVIVTAHSVLATSATITRGAYGTSARAHPMNTAWAHVPMDEDFCEICTTVTHPTDPYVGQMVYETDTQSYKSWNGAAWVDFGGGGANIFQDPNPPGAPVAGTLWLDTDEGAQTGLSSIIAYAEVTANQTGISAETSLTGLTVTVTVPSGRRIRISSQVQVQSATTSGTALVRIKEGATVLQTSQENYNTIGGNGKYIAGSVTISPTAGSHTYNLTLQGTAGTLDMTASASVLAFILVEDITGSLWPAGTTITSGLFSGESWSTWIPTWSNLTVGSGTVTARYIKLGRTVHYYLRLVLNGTTVGSDVTFSLPVPRATTYSTVAPIGTADYLDSGTVDVQGLVWAAAGGTAGRLIVYGTAGAFPASAVISSTAPFTWANNDEINVTGTYEAAS